MHETSDTSLQHRYILYLCTGEASGGSRRRFFWYMGQVNATKNERLEFGILIYKNIYVQLHRLCYLEGSLT